MNDLAPEKELRVALKVLFRATTHCRNLTLNPATPLKKIEDLMDAINHLPEMLARWESYKEKTMLLHFATYDERWAGQEDTFSLRQTYSDLMKYGVVTEQMSQAIPDRKPQIIEILQLLASEERQLSYERNVPDVDITAELRCMWFDDQYHPDDAFFISCFTADELAALAEFHRFYKERVERLPGSEGTVRTWLASPVWRDVMQKAEPTLARLVF